MYATTIPATFVSLYSNEQAYSFNKGENNNEFYPVFHMAHAFNEQPTRKKFDDLVDDTMSGILSYTTINNNSPYKVHIKDRNNITKTINPSGDQALKLITIFTVHCIKNPYYCNASIAEGIDNYAEAFLEKYRKYTDDKLDEMKLVYSKALELGESTLSNSGLNGLPTPTSYNHIVIPKIKAYLYIVTKVTISLDVIRSQGNVYISNKDLVLNAGNVLEMEEHPSLTESNPLMAIKEEVENNLFTVVLVDNENRFSSRYLYLFNEIIEITPIMDKTRKSGLYLYYKMQGKPNQLSIPSCDIEKCGFLYKSKEEAISGGDTSANYKKQIQELEHEFKLKEHSYKQMEQDFKLKEHAHLQRKLELETEQQNNLARIKQLELDLVSKKIESNHSIIDDKQKDRQQEYYYKEKRFQAQDKYDDRSLARSEKMEIIKTGAAILTTLVAIFLLARKV